MHKISLSHKQVADIYGDARALELIKESGFDGVDFCLQNAIESGLLNGDENEMKSYFVRLGEMAKKLGLTMFNAYLPMPCEDETARKNAVKAAAWLGSNYLTLCPIVLEKAENNYNQTRY